MNALDWIDDDLEELQRAGLRRFLCHRDGMQQADRITIDGRELINFGSNDYLGLAADPRLAEAVCRATAETGWGSGASPLVTGRESLHAQLEREIADFEGTEAALLFSSGFAANVGAICSLTGRGDAIFSDAKNHASIIDGCRLSSASVHVYRHVDVSHLRDLLQETKADKKLIVTDSLFSMDGDLAPLADLADLAARHNAMFMTDEAHATGVFGNHGRGVAEHLGVEEGISIRVGTLSKALGSIGGFAAGSQRLIDWLSNRARTYVFSTAMPAAICAAGLRAIEIIRDEPQRRTELLGRAVQLRERLRKDGLQIGSSQSQIVPVILGDPIATMKIAAGLREEGYFIPGIRPPTVPEGESLLRISLSYDHDETVIERLALAISRLGSV